MSQQTALRRRGRACLARGDTPGALEAFAALLALTPDTADAWLSVGYVLADAGRRTEADHHFTRALELDPRCASAWVGLGMGRAGAEALRCFDAAVEIDPAYHGAWFLKSTMLRALGDTVEADACLARARALSPGTYG